MFEQISFYNKLIFFKKKKQAENFCVPNNIEQNNTKLEN